MISLHKVTCFFGKPQILERIMPSGRPHMISWKDYPRFQSRKSLWAVLAVPATIQTRSWVVTTAFKPMARRAIGQISNWLRRPTSKSSGSWPSGTKPWWRKSMDTRSGSVTDSAESSMKRCKVHVTTGSLCSVMMPKAMRLRSSHLIPCLQQPLADMALSSSAVLKFTPLVD